MNVFLLSLILSAVFCRIRCGLDRPMRRELQTNKTIFMYTCAKRGICDTYAEQNGLKHIGCQSLCELSWKWANSEIGAEPLMTLSPDSEDTESAFESTEMAEEDGGSKNISIVGLPLTKPNKVSVIGKHRVSLSEGGAEPREKQSQKRKQTGKSFFSDLNVVKSREQKLTELKPLEKEKNETESEAKPSEEPDEQQTTEEDDSEEQENTETVSQSDEDTDSDEQTTPDSDVDTTDSSADEAESEESVSTESNDSDGSDSDDSDESVSTELNDSDSSDSDYSEEDDK